MPRHMTDANSARLWECVEACIAAMMEATRLTGGALPYAVDLKTWGRHEPECLRPWGVAEVQEACDFLERMGIMEFPGRRSGA